MSSLASSEFVALSQGQLRLLARGVGATLSVVYVAEEWLGGNSANLIPIAVYPDAALEMLQSQPLQLPSEWTGDGPRETGVSTARPMAQDSTDFSRDLGLLNPSRWRKSATHVRQSSQTKQGNSSKRAGQVKRGDAEVGLPALPSNNSLHQAVQPLYYENKAIGLLVIAREGQDWQDEDYGQLEQVAYTLSAACVMERRLQWLQARFRQQEIAQEQRQDILDNLIHQFRNPLTALRTFGKLLVRRLSTEDPNHRVAEGIIRESDRLQELLVQLNAAVDESPLILSEAEIVDEDWERVPQALPSSVLLPGASPLGGEPLVLEACDILAILQPLLDSFEAIAQEQNQSLRFLCPPTPLPPIQGSPMALREILSNLIDNALKYGRANGTVVVLVQSMVQENQVPDTVCIIISDDGPGIPAADLPRLFERHYRGIQAQGGKPGTGLGLAIARSLVEQMGGHLEVMSPAGPLHPQALLTLRLSSSAPSSPPSVETEGPGSAFLVSLSPWHLEK